MIQHSLQLNYRFNEDLIKSRGADGQSGLVSRPVGLVKWPTIYNYIISDVTWRQSVRAQSAGLACKQFVIWTGDTFIGRRNERINWTIIFKLKNTLSQLFSFCFQNLWKITLSSVVKTSKLSNYPHLLALLSKLKKIFHSLDQNYLTHTGPKMKHKRCVCLKLSVKSLWRSMRMVKFLYKTILLVLPK